MLLTPVSTKTRLGCQLKPTARPEGPAQLKAQGVSPGCPSHATEPYKGGPKPLPNPPHSHRYTTHPRGHGVMT